MRNMAYIGITGIKTLAESDALARMTRELDFPASHCLMVGGLASYKGLKLGYVSDPKQYVLPNELNRSFLRADRLLNIVHYNSKIEGLSGQLDELLEVVDRADGVQLNIPWPQVSVIRRLREASTTVILQISSAASAMLEHDPDRIVDKLAGYEGLIDYVLIDPSGGVGLDFEPDYAAYVLAAFVTSGLSANWGIAGGLGPGRLGVLELLLEIYPELSWDAQARLRTVEGTSLDLAACRQYLVEGVEILNKQPGRDSTLAST
ncbi:MAG: hypothetical protein ABIS59_01070 [Candidatus Saccharibacteria bacterium]